MFKLMAQRVSQAVNERTKPHALHHASNLDVLALVRHERLSYGYVMGLLLPSLTQVLHPGSERKDT
jgi:hypothetical protein